MTKTKKNLFIDLSVLFLSIILAIWLGDSHAIESLLTATEGSEIIGALLGGLFFTSIFTTAPSIIILGEIAQNSSVLQTAIFGAIGALIGDLIMFKFLRDRLAKDFYALFHIDMNQRYFRLPRFRWLIVLLAGLIIASPFPDELGLAMLGFSNTNTNKVIPISLIFNFLGILAITALAA
jgi:hypothetical protein